MKNAKLDTALYDHDFYAWISQQVGLLREGKLDQLDLPNLIEEIEDMGKSQKQALESNLKVVLMHLLKWKVQTDKRSNSWKSTIREHRRRISKQLKDSPSLRGCVVKTRAAGAKVGNCIPFALVPMSKSNPFKWRHYQPEIILLCVR
ncbi:MAG: DUF29 family protein, partial [Chroococcidiopsidaceae cyanobacterium CP_BM_RX_35]|nr:DUF29 family protein [Chroococcidiopsidaceae cyanobacterium CP_BM_RX_35]